MEDYAYDYRIKVRKIWKTCNLGKNEIVIANKKRKLNKIQERFYFCSYFSLYKIYLKI